ncbi:DUF559 domain-containing protein [Mesonia sp. K7]|uniref:DUF559 domain-containing protein n=1 Tax=Mesonia sp. K7 TaxID=2218606 RepID=UPI000DAA4FF2|nr:DUF559 domain-containing protein [Mesonia sp. K7]PZD79095.1 hypothetical protein DNG35_03560 [Mesonia sp. K7]
MKIYNNPKLKKLARKLRNNATKSEIKLWNILKGKQMHNYDFQIVILAIENFISNFEENKTHP